MAREWSMEQRKKQAEIINKSKPWNKSTGPKSDEGKNKVSQNAYKHGMRSRDYDEICQILEWQKALVKSVLIDRKNAASIVS